MDVAPASATNMIKKLAEMRLLVHAPYKAWSSPAQAPRLLWKPSRHHRLLELYLNQALGYAWDEVDAEADRLEHAISENSRSASTPLSDFLRWGLMAKRFLASKET